MMRRSATARRTSRALYSGPAFKVGVDQVIQVAVEDPVHVGGLRPGAVVLYHLVGVEDVGADLAPPLDVRPFAFQGGQLLLALLPLELEEARPQDPHRYLAVLVLAALVLALDDGTGGEVCDPDRRVGLVDVLSSGSRRPVRVYLEVLLVDLDLDRVAHDRGDRDRREASVSPSASVERADPDQPMYPPLG